MISLYPMYAIFDGRSYCEDNKGALFFGSKGDALSSLKDLGDMYGPLCVVQINCPADIHRFSPEEDNAAST